MSKAVMNLNGTLGHKTGSVVSGGILTNLSVPELNVKADGSPVFAENISFSLSGASAPGFISGSVIGAGFIPASAVKTKANNLPVMREGDYVDATFTGTYPDPPGGDGTVVGAVEVTSAGQTKVKAE